VTLASQPTADVVIELRTTDPTEGTGNPTTLTFTPANWKVSQRVTITGVDDPMEDGDISYSVGLHSTRSVDRTYARLSIPSILLTNRDDNDVPTGSGLLVGSGRLAVGQQREFTFQGAGGQRVYYDAIDTNNDFLRVEVLGPSGRVLYSGIADEDSGPWTLTHTGTYTVRIGGTPGPAGDFAVRLLDVAHLPVLPLNQDERGVAHPRYEAALYRFEAAAGSRFQFSDLGSIRAGARWQVDGAQDLRRLRRVPDPGAVRRRSDHN